MELRTWILHDTMRQSSAVGTKFLSASGSAETLAAAMPEAIVKGSGFGSDVEEVLDWGDLLDEQSPAAVLTAWKAKATFAMRQVMAVVPTLTDKDLKVVHRTNSLGAVRTEIWTARDFASGELVIAPWTPRDQGPPLHNRPFSVAGASSRCSTWQSGALLGWQEAQSFGAW